MKTSKSVLKNIICHLKKLDWITDENKQIRADIEKAFGQNLLSPLTFDKYRQIVINLEKNGWSMSHSTRSFEEMEKCDPSGCHETVLILAGIHVAALSK